MLLKSLGDPHVTVLTSSFCDAGDWRIEHVLSGQVFCQSCHVPLLQQCIWHANDPWQERNERKRERERGREQKPKARAQLWCRRKERTVFAGVLLLATSSSSRMRRENNLASLQLVQWTKGYVLGFSSDPVQSPFCLFAPFVFRVS